MSLRARREHEKETMRNAILAAAVKIIIAEGYDNLSMRKIANEISYSPTTIYTYYKDKAQIINDILQEVYRKVVYNAAEVVKENKSAPIDKQLELSFKSFINTMVSNAEMGMAVIRSGTKAMFEKSDEAKPPEENGVFILREVLLEGQRQSIFRRLDENIPWMLITALLGFSMNAIENRLYLNADWCSMVHVYVEMLVNGLLIKND